MKRIVLPCSVVVIAGLIWSGPSAAQGGKKIEVLKATGKITSDDPKDKVRKSCHHKVHTVKLEADVTYTIDASSNDFDAYLRLEDVQGKELAKNDDVNPKTGDTNARIVFKCDRSDQYRIVVTTYSGRETGTYQLSVTGVEAKKKKDQ